MPSEANSEDDWPRTDVSRDNSVGLLNDITELRHHAIAKSAGSAKNAFFFFIIRLTLFTHLNLLMMHDK